MEQNKTQGSLRLEDYRQILQDPASNQILKDIARRRIFEILDKRE